MESEFQELIGKIREKISARIAGLDKINDEIKLLESVLKGCPYLDWEHPLDDIVEQGMVLWSIDEKRICYSDAESTRPLLECTAVVRLLVFSHWKAILNSILEKEI